MSLPAGISSHHTAWVTVPGSSPDEVQIQLAGQQAHRRVVELVL